MEGCLWVCRNVPRRVVYPTQDPSIDCRMVSSRLTAGAIIAPSIVGCWVPLCTDFFFQHSFFFRFCLNTSVSTVWKYVHVYVTYKKICVCSILRTDMLGEAYHHIPVYKGCYREDGDSFIEGVRWKRQGLKGEILIGQKRKFFHCEIILWINLPWEVMDTPK